MNDLMNVTMSSEGRAYDLIVTFTQVSIQTLRLARTKNPMGFKSGTAVYQLVESTVALQTHIPSVRADLESLSIGRKV